MGATDMRRSDGWMRRLGRAGIVETNEEFDSLTDCARALGRSLSTVAYACAHGTTTAGFHLEEVMPNAS